MPELTDAGRDAMARELLHLASDGKRDWDQATPQLRAEFKTFIDRMVDRASEAETDRIANAQPPSKGVLP
jgi:hypothetical protein